MLESRLSGLLRAAYRHRVAVLLGAGVLALVSIRSLGSLTFDSNVFNLLPRGGPAVRSFRTYLSAFGSLDRLYIVFEAPDHRFVSDHSSFIEAYVDELRRTPEIRSVDAGPTDAGENWGYVLDRQLLLVGPHRVREVLARFSAEAIQGELRHVREILTLPSSDVKALVRQDPLGLLPLLRERLGAEAAALNIDPTRAGYVTPDGGSQLVIVEPSRPSYDTAFCRQLMQRLDAIEARARTTAGEVTGPSAITIQRVGAYRVALETEGLIRGEGIQNAVMSIASVLLLVYLVFRSMRVLLAGAIPLLLAALLTTALNGFWWQLSTAASGGAAMLFGLGIDGLLLLYVRYLEERGRGFDTEQAIGNLSPTVVSMMLGFATTSATFFGLVPIDFPSLEEIGRLIGTAIVVSGLLAIGLVPALLPRTLSPRQARPLTTEWLGRIVVSRRRTILWTAAAATVLLAVASFGLRVVPTLQKLQPQTPATRAEQEIFQRFSVRNDVVLMLAEGPDLNRLLDANGEVVDRLRATAPAMRVTSPVSFIPTRAEQDAVRRMVRESGISAADVAERFVREAADAGFRPDAFSPFLERLPRLVDPNRSLTYEGYREQGLTDLVGRYVALTPTGYVTVAYAYPHDPADLAVVEEAVTSSGGRLQLTGITLINREISTAFTPQFLTGGLIGSVGVVLLIFVVFRTVRHTLLAVVPTGVGLIWSAGVLALMRVELDLFSAFALLMCIGIGVDYSIHLLHRHTTAPTGDITGSLVRVGPAILLAWATTIIGFGTLVTSSYGPLRSLAIVSVVTITCCLLTSLLVLPAALLPSDHSSKTDTGSSGDTAFSPSRP